MGCTQSKATDKKKSVKQTEEPKNGAPPAVPEPQPPKSLTMSFKVILLGNSAVGKTCLMTQFKKPHQTSPYSHNGWSLPTPAKCSKCSRPENAMEGSSQTGVAWHPSPSPSSPLDSPQGCDSTSKTIEVDGREVKLQIWYMRGINEAEPPGMGEKMLCRGADGFVVVYDVTNKKSFEEAILISKRVATSYKAKDGGEPSILILGNKIDCDETAREVSTDDGMSAAAKSDISFAEVSALSMLNVEEAFQRFGSVLVAGTKITKGTVDILDVADLSVTETVVEQLLINGIQNISALSLGSGIPTEASLPIAVTDAFKKLVAASIATKYDFNEFGAGQSIKDAREGKLAAPKSEE